jgi:hypothetical protein
LKEKEEEIQKSGMRGEAKVLQLKKLQTCGKVKMLDSPVRDVIELSSNAISVFMQKRADLEIERTTTIQSNYEKGAMRRKLGKYFRQKFASELEISVKTKS